LVTGFPDDISLLINLQKELFKINHEIDVIVNVRSVPLIPNTLLEKYSSSFLPTFFPDDYPTAQAKAQASSLVTEKVFLYLFFFFFNI
jgi:hypothetical protein